MAEFDAGAATQRGLQMTAAGAAIGSAVPLLGTAVGAGAGALLGLGLGIYDYWRSKGDDPEEAARKAHQFDSSFVATPQILARTDFSQAMNDAQAQQAMAFGQAQQVRRQVGLADALQAQAEARRPADRGDAAGSRPTARGAGGRADRGAARRQPRARGSPRGRRRRPERRRPPDRRPSCARKEQQAARAQLAQVLSGARGSRLSSRGLDVAVRHRRAGHVAARRTCRRRRTRSG